MTRQMTQSDAAVEQQYLIKERSASVTRSPRGYEVTARWFGRRMALNSRYDWSESGQAFPTHTEAKDFAWEAFLICKAIGDSGVLVMRLGDGVYKIGRAGRNWWLHVNTKLRLLSPELKRPNPPRVDVPDNWCLLDVVRAMVVAVTELDGRKKK